MCSQQLLLRLLLRLDINKFLCAAVGSLRKDKLVGELNAIYLSSSSWKASGVFGFPFSLERQQPEEERSFQYYMQE
jgi:hypothetical protein